MHYLITTLLFCMTATFFRAEAVENPIDTRLKEVLAEFFPNTPQDNLSWSLLSGGYSDARNYKIDCASCETHHYVLRQLPANEDVNREFWAFQQAAKLGVAPHVYAVSMQHKAILTDYYKTQTLSTRQAHQKEIIRLIGAAIRTIHTLPKNPYDKVSVAVKYEELAKALQPTPEILEALHVIKDSQEKLSKLPGHKATIHGDLNPRNVFVLADRGVKVIDWSDTTWDDGFFDLTYFALFQSYGQEEIQRLLESYLGHEPSATDWQRYSLTGMINLAGFSITLNRVAHEIAQRDGHPLSEESHVQGLAYYVEKFSEGGELSAQFIYDWSKAALKAASHLKPA